ncbi:uncharacterized protein HGUI_03941 [Hanseniaspora guilliermondii]|uniref:Cytochrome b5 heme-binding domain-containing protein n=1 Tax=Hanseniaspora guilliermondii TaxID=56406 RepID=A0A1L0B7D5_9ASCO|nr:uncharacterized protein HGUI_03941 [Hanseniaspora guilliermondii]
MFNFNRQKKTLQNSTPNIKISSDTGFQAQCSTLPHQQPNNTSVRKKIELLPDHGPLNWLQLYDKQNIQIKIILMKVISILLSIFENSEFKSLFIKDNELKNPEQVDFLIYLHENVFARPTDNYKLLQNLQIKNDFKRDRVSIFEGKNEEIDHAYNLVFEQILKVIDMNTLTGLFAFKAQNRTSQLTGFKHTKPQGLVLRPECVLNNYKLTNVNLFWICLNKKVYYITPYLLYHPGGDAILLKLLTSSRNTTERVDKMKEFQKYHRWVNETDLLSPYLIGYL